MGFHPKGEERGEGERRATVDAHVALHEDLASGSASTNGTPMSTHSSGMSSPVSYTALWRYTIVGLCSATNSASLHSSLLSAT